MFPVFQILGSFVSIYSHAFWTLLLPPSPQPKSFHKMTHAVSSFCHQKGIGIIFYLKDTIVLVHSFEEAFQHWDYVMSLMSTLSFLSNLEKCDLAHSESFMFLGSWDTTMHGVSLTEEKVSVLQAAACLLLAANSVSCWDVQKFLGSSNLQDHEPDSNLDPFSAVSSRSTNDHLIVTGAVICQQRSERICHGRLQCFTKLLVPPTPKVTIATDALCKEWGSVWGADQLAGQWEQACRDHINVLELPTIFLAVWAWAPCLHGKVVTLHCDNRSAITYIIEEGGTHLATLLRRAS